MTAVFTEKEWAALQAELKVTNPHDGNTLGCVVFLDPAGSRRSQILVFINVPEILGRKWYPMDSVIAHETMHIVQFIELYIGERLSQEGEAYLFENLYTQLINAFKRMKK